MNFVYKGLIALLGSIAGIALPTACAYGTEKVQLDLSGQVRDEQQSPIAELNVGLYVQGGYQEQKRTDANGEFSFSREIDLYGDPGTILFMEDTDGDSNGGDFESQVVLVPAESIGPGQPVELDIEMYLKD